MTLHISFLDSSHIQGLNENLDFESIEKIGQFDLLNLINSDQIKEQAANTDIIITGKLRIDRPVIDALPKLKLIIKAGVGCDKFDIKYANSKGILIMNLPDYGSQQVAHYTLMLILSLAYSSYQYFSATKLNQWKDSQFSYPLQGIAGKTIGIIGFGNIARELTPLLTHLNAKCLVNTNYPDPNYLVQYVDLDYLSKHSDFVVILKKLTSSNQNTIDSKFFKEMKPSAYLINPARAGLVNKTDLVTALQQKLIAGAAFDVFWEEPPLENDPLIKLPNFICTPHMAWGTYSIRQKMIHQIAELIESFLSGHPRNLVSPAL